MTTDPSATTCKPGEMCAESKKILADPLLACKILRSKNTNVVCYRARLQSDGKTLDKDNPLEVFWLKVHPEYVIAHRKAGKMDDRTELTVLENTMAYGVTVEPIQNKPNEYKVIFVALKSKEIILKIDPKDGIPKCFVINDDGSNAECVMKEMFVQTESSWIPGLPRVAHVTITGHDCKTGEPMKRKLVKGKDI